ncbi:hypothetical protein [uncultured Helicobacter sp.]|uniref:barstar family protein n=1 Tax=uncultured Helicobacter sp. TaxID=175537 RepID=UPI00374E2C09
MPKLYNMQYGIYTINSEHEIPKKFIEDKYTFYVKINGNNIKDYHFSYMDIMQNALEFPIKDCVGNTDAFWDWITDLSWLRYGYESEDSGYQNIILVFTHWNKVGRRLFCSGKDLREKILKDFIGEKKGSYGALQWLACDDSDDFYFIDGRHSLTCEYEPAFRVFNIYLIP